MSLFVVYVLWSRRQFRDKITYQQHNPSIWLVPLLHTSIRNTSNKSLLSVKSNQISEKKTLGLFCLTHHAIARNTGKANTSSLCCQCCSTCSRAHSTGHTASALGRATVYSSSDRQTTSKAKLSTSARLLYRQVGRGYVDNQPHRPTCL